MEARVTVKVAIGDLVDVRERKLAYYGKVKEFLSGDRLVVRFKEPREPKDAICCDKCGGIGSLSVDGATGEIVHMRSGCGYGHGFREWDEVVEKGAVINITDKREREKFEEKKNEARMKICSLPLSQDAIRRMLDALEKEFKSTIQS